MKCKNHVFKRSEPTQVISKEREAKEKFKKEEDTMFIKIGVDASALKKKYGNFSIIVNVKEHKKATIVRFDEISMNEIKEEIFEIEENEIFTISAHFDDPHHFLETRVVELTPECLKFGEDSLIEIENDQKLKVFLRFTAFERIPTDWFEKSVSLLCEQPRPWYLKVEDVYNFLKYVAKTIELSMPPSMSMPTCEELCEKIDFFALQVAKKYLTVTVEDGFSMMMWIDNTLETLFQNIDANVDTVRFRVALSLQKLRKEITLIVVGVVNKLQEKTVVIQQNVQTLLERNQWISEAIGKLMTTLKTTTTTATEWVAHEREDVVHALALIQETSTTKLTQAQATLLGVPTAVYHKVSDEVSHRIDDAQSTLLNLPVAAHPYVVNAVGATQPYVSSMLTTATPYVESLVKAPLVENLLLDTKEALEKNDNVNNLVQKASQILTQVTDYCTNEKFFSETTEATPYVAPASTRI